MTRLFRQALDGVIANAKPEHRDHRYDFLCGLCVFFRMKSPCGSGDCHHVSRLRISELRKSIAQTTMTIAQIAVPA